MIAVLLPAMDIPLDSTVTKRTGEKEYTLRDRLRIYGEENSPKEIKAADGSRFLVSENGDANVVSGTTKLLWHVEEEELIYYLKGSKK